METANATAVKKERKATAERVKLTAAQTQLVIESLLSNREQVLADVAELDPIRHKRFIDQANSQGAELANLAANFGSAGYVSFTVGE